MTKPLVEGSGDGGLEINSKVEGRKDKPGGEQGPQRITFVHRGSIGKKLNKPPKLGADAFSNKADKGLTSRRHDIPKFNPGDSPLINSVPSPMTRDDIPPMVQSKTSTPKKALTTPRSKRVKDDQNRMPAYATASSGDASKPSQDDEQQATAGTVPYHKQQLPSAGRRKTKVDLLPASAKLFPDPKPMHELATEFSATFRKHDTPRKVYDHVIPPSIIPKSFHVVEKSPMAPTDKRYKTEYVEADESWYTTLLPAAVPASRGDITLLDRWVDEMIETNIDKDGDADKAATQAHQIYSMAFQELIRQVSLECVERGDLMAKIWRRYLRLFEKLLHNTVKARRHTLKEVEADVERVLEENKNLRRMQLSHAEEVNKLIESKNQSDELIQIMSQQMIKAKKMEEELDEANDRQQDKIDTLDKLLQKAEDRIKQLESERESIASVLYRTANINE